MAIIRIATERLYLFLFWTARLAFLAQGLAMGTALLAAPWASRPDAPPWLEIAFRSSLWIGGTFFTTGVLLFAARYLPLPSTERVPRPEGASAPAAVAEPTWPWPLLLGLSLVGLAALACWGVSDLWLLWREILDLLRQIGFWEELQRSGAYSGIVMIPVLVALFVPSLEAATAFFLIAAPLGMILLLATRSRHLPRLFVMMVACQAGLVLAGLLGADAFSRLATEGAAAAKAGGGVEGAKLAEALARAQSVLGSTAAAFVLPMLGHLAWLPFLLLSRQVGAFFTAGTVAASVQSRKAPPFEPAGVRPVSSAPAQPAATWSAVLRGRRGAAQPTRASERHARLALVAFGCCMLVFAAGGSLRSRARYLSSEPAPGSMLSSSPTAVRVSFDHALDPSSSLSVTRVFAQPKPGEAATTITTSAGLDPNDPERRTLEAELPGMSDGLYRVVWRSAPASGGIARHGSFFFGVGMPVPESTTQGEPLEERDIGERRRRRALVGGLLLVTLGVLLPRLPRRA